MYGGVHHNLSSPQRTHEDIDAVSYAYTSYVPETSCTPLQVLETSWTFALAGVMMIMMLLGNPKLTTTFVKTSFISSKNCGHFGNRGCTPGMCASHVAQQSDGWCPGYLVMLFISPLLRVHFSCKNLYQLFYMLIFSSPWKAVKTATFFYYLAWKRNVWFLMNCVLFSENFSTDTSFEQKGFVPQVLTHELSMDFRCGEASPSSNTICNCIWFTFLPFMKLRRTAEPTRKVYVNCILFQEY